MVADCAFVGSSAVLGGVGGRYVPFDEGRAGYEGDVVEVFDAERQFEADSSRFGDECGCHLILLFVLVVVLK